MPSGNLRSIWYEELYCSHSTPSHGAAERVSTVRGRFPYTHCGPRVTAEQARLYDDMFGRDTLPEDDPVLHPVEPTGAESYWLAQFVDYDTERALSGPPEPPPPLLAV